MSEITPSKSTVLNDVEITGTLTFKGRLDFDGALKTGSIAGETLFIGKSAEIQGDIMAESLRMEGTVSGNITAMEKCDLGESAKLTGDLTSLRLVMADGATVIGQMHIGPNAQRLKQKK
jgi:cytoskeletal protein CcmA (bactofilin family)